MEENLIEENLINDEPQPFIIPYIYIYSEETKEYLSKEQAEEDKAESQKQGHFVALVPQFATLLEAPEYEENQIPVYNKTVSYEEHTIIDPETGEEKTVIEKIITENWEVKADYRKNFYKVDEFLNVSDITEIGEIEEIKVTKELGEEIKSNKSLFKIADNEVVRKTDEELLLEAKETKQAENVSKCKEKRYSQEFMLELQEKECLFDTTSQTQSDLQTAGLVTSTGATYNNWVCNNGTVINLTNEDVQIIFARFFMLISPLYTIEKQYAEAIEACTSIEEVEAIVIDYTTNDGV